MIAGLVHSIASQPFGPSPSPATVPGANIFTSAFILSIAIWAPVLMAAVIGVMPNPRGRYDTLIKQIAFFTNFLVLFLLFVAYNQFQNFLPSMQYEENRSWLPAIGATYHLGVDGPAILMLMLSALIGIIAVLASLGIRTRVRAYFALLLLTQACVTGAIAAHDLFVLVLFWSAATVPLALLILGWGGPRREAAAWRLVGYWGAGTLALVLAVVGLYVASGGTSFDMDVVLKNPIGPRAEVVVAVALLIAGATRLPLFPLHGWARDVYADAPIGVSVVIAGSASRLGGYLLLRVLVGGEPDGAKLVAPLVAAVAAITVVYGAVAALRSPDVRHAAANLALIPGGVTALGLAALTPLSIAGSVLSLFAGGMASALIVSAFATLSDRAQTRNLAVLSGVAARMPKVAWLTVLAALGLLGVPLMASFTSNEMTFFGAFKTQPVGAFAVAAGLAVAAIAVAVIIQRVLFGPPNPDAPAVSDSSLSESWYLGLLAGALLWVGIVPGGPKIPGTDTPLFDPGLVNQMVANIPEISAPYSGTSATP
ncbi:MAG TPA: NADH-quinone oxidoreductase subunit M [Candidatus Dormibacteraeota bacterium]|nr:NADH-quinone oxidoreductase subunit M [Candidatus Dormibacteraeota bacterium]